MRIGSTKLGLGLSLVVATTAGCGTSERNLDPPAPVIDLVFEPGSVALGEGRSASARIRNAGDAVVGPIELAALAVSDAGGGAVPGAGLSVVPSEIPTLAAGASNSLALTIEVPSTVTAGEYTARLEARVSGRPVAALGASFSVATADGPRIASLEITGGSVTTRQGDVLAFDVTALDEQGDTVTDPPVSWRVEPDVSGHVTADGAFVAYSTGANRVIAEAPGVADTVEVAVSARDVPTGFFEVGARPAIERRYTSDHWEYGDVAYTGTWGCRNVTGGRCGNLLYVWDISSRMSPSLADSVEVDARVVNDVKVRADGSLAVITHEASADGANGITLLDVARPSHPAVITRFAPPDLSPGVHNVWIEGDYVYAVVDGSVPSAGLRVIDVSDPASPRIVSSFYGGGSFLHDVYVRDGLAFLSHWTAGLIVLDVGGGQAGGSPAAPVEVGRIVPAGYRVHNAWYWPEAGYVFLGDEIGLPGRVVVVDVSDPANPREVASYSVEGAAPHNFWLDESAAIAYFAWYENGIHAVDVSGRLLGELDRQGRRIASLQYDVSGACISAQGTCTWAPQLHDGHVYLSDMNSGLWALRPTF